MVIKLYISGISGNKEVKKKQQRVQMILDSKQINYEAIDITEPGKEKDKEFMQQNGKVRESLGKHPLPPQIFNDDDFCGDYEDFDMANEVDELEKFLHIETSSKELENGSKHNGENGGLCEESVTFKPSFTPKYDPYDYHTYKIKWDSVNGVQEEIIENVKPGGENEQSEEVTKSEVNGESEAVPPSEPFSENVGDNKTETLTEVPEKEETENEKETVDENSEVKNEENVTENQENEAETEKEEEKDKEEETEKEEEIPKEDTEVKNEEEPEVEKPPEEESPNPENVEEKVDNEPEENESEKEEESENESPQSEKSEED